jgi:hypothetical protein
LSITAIRSARGSKEQQVNVSNNFKRGQILANDRLTVANR